MKVNHQKKQKNRIMEFGFQWFCENKQNQYGTPLNPIKCTTAQEAVEYKEWMDNSFKRGLVSLIECDGCIIVISAVGAAEIKAYFVRPGYDREKLFHAYNKYMHIVCGQPLLPERKG